MKQSNQNHRLQSSWLSANVPIFHLCSKRFPATNVEHSHGTNHIKTTFYKIDTKLDIKTTSVSTEDISLNQMKSCNQDSTKEQGHKIDCTKKYTLLKHWDKKRYLTLKLKITREEKSHLLIGPRLPPSPCLSHPEKYQRLQIFSILPFARCSVFGNICYIFGPPQLASRRSCW